MKISMDNFKVRKFEMTDYESYKSLFLKVYGYGISDNKFRKKNLDNPFSEGNPIIYLLMDGDRIIGANSFFPIEIFIEGTPFLGVQSGDSMILREYRGMNLFKMILTYSMNSLSDMGYKFIVGLPNKDSHSGFLKLDFKSVDKLNIYSTVLNAKVSTRVQNSKFLTYVAKTGVINAWMNIVRGFSVYSELSVEFHNGFSNEMLDFIEKNEERKNTRVNNCKEYLIWKYHEFNKGKYIIRKKDTKEIIAILLCSIHDNGTIDILDYFYDSAKGYNITNLINTFCRYIYDTKKNISRISIWSLNNYDVEVFRRYHGFSRTSEDIYYIFKNLSMEEEIEGLKSLPISRGFSDIV